MKGKNNHSKKTWFNGSTVNNKYSIITSKTLNLYKIMIQLYNKNAEVMFTHILCRWNQREINPHCSL